ncbi:RNA polymerase sigma factor SigJ [Streptomonospora salina]|uniref:RNA polymerase sigma-70 factor (ECF subfamily) n=1 Tax=Streptomonospora salina TaxID=104205 RepID=A0A841E7G8_9ACTN|nr:RNA polymerase sigma factor SigJ [Streptomonospora salina]MBB5997063.1 RNA polymerase sigma-70 factor (ECF subfamily) [Streptomonospora salina]
MSHQRPPSRRNGVDSETDAAEFRALRPRLLSVAYSLLGSMEEAEDTVQEAWLRLDRTRSRGEHDEIRDTAAWLVTTVSRLALDTLRSARRRREEYVGEWLPEPVVGHPLAVGGPAAAGHGGGDPADRVTLDESMSMAMLVVLESLSPAERTSFVLHDVFGLAFDEVGRAVGRTPAACRQLAARARKHVQAQAPRFDVDDGEHRRIVDAFRAAVQGGDLDGLVALLDPDVVLRSDGGGIVRSARRPIRGSRKVARFLLGAASRFGAHRALRPAEVNGRPGLVGICGGRTEQVVAFAVSGGRIGRIHAVMNPQKLKWAGGGAEADRAGAAGPSAPRVPTDRTFANTPIPSDNTPQDTEENP